MTIPTRKAPEPPNFVSSGGRNTQNQSRYTPTTDWDDQPFRSAWDVPSGGQQQTKKPPPPRPPPPKIKPSITTKKPSTARKPSSNTILSNIMSRARLNKPKPAAAAPKLPAPPPPPISTTHIKSSSSFSSTASSTPSYADKQLITFDSPPGSPTFTQKSNSDCVSVDSFSSDSNYSPNNGFSTESGFEDDFVLDNFKPYKRMTPVDPFDMLDEAPPPTRPQIAQKPMNVGNASFYTAFSVSSKPTEIVRQETLCNGKDLITAMPTRTGPTIIRAVTKKSQAPKPIIEKQQQPQDDPESPPSPPMPSCPPPPPPKEYFEEVAETEESFGVGLYDFNGETDGDLPFREGEKIYLLRKVNDEWLFGRNRRGCEGMFPASFIEIKVPLAVVDDLPQSRGSTPTCDVPKEYIARALYDFIAETPEDLTIRVNDEIKILNAINEEWLVGEIGSRRGQFPASYVEYL